MNSAPHPHAKKIISAEVIVSVLILLATGYVFYQNTQYTKEFAKQSKTTVSPTPTIVQADSSYIVIYTNPEIELVLKDSSGREVSKSFLETSPGSKSNNIIAAREIYYAKPETGVYFAEFTSTKSAAVSYEAEFLLYDKEGNLSDASKSGILKNGKDLVKINFNKLNSSMSAIQN